MLENGKIQHNLIKLREGVLNSLDRSKETKVPEATRAHAIQVQVQQVSLKFIHNL